jgi:putative transposase
MAEPLRGARQAKADREGEGMNAAARLHISFLEKLPGMPVWRRNTRKYLVRIGARRVGRGLYHLDEAAIAKFPEDAQGELLRRFLSSARPVQSENCTRVESGRTPRAADSVPGIEPGGARRIFDRADSRAELSRTFDRFFIDNGGALKDALKAFARSYNSGEIEVSVETRAFFPQRSRESIQRDWRKWRRDGAQALVPGFGKRRGRTIITETSGMRGLILSMISDKPHVRVTRIQEALQVRFPDSYPSVRTLDRFVAEWKRENPALFMRLKDPDDYKRKFSVSLGNAAADITCVNQIWEVDGTRLECQCVDGLFHLNAAIDVCSRWMVMELSPSASGAATASLLRKAIVEMGVPALIKSDWGREYLNARIERAVRRLQITWRKVARPYSGELKPFIERGQGTVLHAFFEQVPGYKGHNVKQASEIRARHSFEQRRGERRNLVRLYNVELSRDELQSLLDRWLKAVYGHRKHAGLHGRTPAEAFAEGESRGEVKRISDERELDLLLGEDGTAVVGVKGVRIGGALFWDDALADGWLGREVQWVRTRDAGRILLFSTGDAPQFICIAFNLELSGIDRQVAAIAAKSRQKQYMREKLDELRRERRQHKPEKLLMEIIEHAEARVAAALPAEKSIVEALPYTNEGLRAAADALAALDEESPLSAEREGARKSRRAENKAVAEYRAHDEAGRERWERYLSLRDRPIESLSEDDQVFLRVYVTTSAYRVRAWEAGERKLA